MPLLADQSSGTDWPAIVGAAVAVLGMIGGFVRWRVEGRLYRIAARLDKLGTLETIVRTHTDKALQLDSISLICYRGRLWRFWRFVVGQPAQRGYFVMPSRLERPPLPMSFDEARTAKIYHSVALDREHRLPPVDPGVPGEPLRTVEKEELRVLVSIGGRSVVRPVECLDGVIQTHEEHEQHAARAQP
jgi:hypothetical protein